MVGLLTNDRRSLRVQVGDVVATSGSCASLAPFPNLSVGQGDAGRRTARLRSVRWSRSTPTADLDNLNFVVVLLYLPPTETNGEICN